MLRISFTIFLALAAWIHPAVAVSAFAEPPQDNPNFINYELHRKTIESVRNEQGADDGQRLLQPQQNLQPKNNQSVQKVDASHSPDIQSNRKRPIPKVGQSATGRGEYNGRHYPKEEVQELIRKYSAEYKINAETPLCIAQLESGYNQFSKNKSSSASGVFQYIAGTWKATDEGKAGFSVYDASANVKAAVKYMSSRGNARPWTVASKCPPIQKIN